MGKAEAFEAVYEIERNWPAAGAFTGPIKEYLDAAESPQPQPTAGVADAGAGDSAAP